jgi:hypothetical protein
MNSKKKKYFLIFCTVHALFQPIASVATALLYLLGREQAPRQAGPGGQKFQAAAAWLLRVA